MTPDRKILTAIMLLEDEWDNSKTLQQYVVWVRVSVRWYVIMGSLAKFHHSSASILFLLLNALLSGAG